MIKSSTLFLFVFLGLFNNSKASILCLASYKQPTSAIFTFPSVKEINTKNPEWIKGLFTQDQHYLDKSYASLYTRNMTLAGQFFLNRLSQPTAETFDSFVELTQKQHEVAVLGSNPKRPYGGETDLKSLALQWSRWGATQMKELKKEELAEQRDRAGRFREGELTLGLETYIDRPSYSLERREMVLNLYDKVIKIDGIPEEHLPHNEIDKSAMTHHYPTGEARKYYLTKMFEQFMKIKNCQSCDQKTAVQYLADYYHTAINAHLFERVNHSVLMTQVNVVLLALKLPAMVHDIDSLQGIRIDIAALFMSQNKFREYFANHAVRGQ